MALSVHYTFIPSLSRENALLRPSPAFGTSMGPELWASLATGQSLGIGAVDAKQVRDEN